MSHIPPVSTVHSDLLTSALDRNLADAVRHIARYGGGALDENKDRILAAGVHSYRGPLLNAVLRIDHAADPAAVVADAIAFFDNRRHPFVIWTSRHGDKDLAAAATAAGMVELEDAGAGPAMALTRPPDRAPLPADAEFTIVDSRAKAREFATVAGLAYSTVGQPRAIAESLFGAHDVLLAPHALGILLRLEGVPTSCALLLESTGCTGIYFVGTLAEARGRGLGEAVTRRASSTAFERGARYLVLCAADRAVPVYRRVGFQEISRYTLFGKPSNRPVITVSE